MRHLLLLLLTGGIVAGQPRRRLLELLQFLLQLVQRIRRRVRIAKLLLHRINLLLQIGVARRTAAGGRTRGLFQFAQRRVLRQILGLILESLGGAGQIAQGFGAGESCLAELVAQFFH